MRNRKLGVDVLGTVISNPPGAADLWRASGERFLELEELNYAITTLIGLAGNPSALHVHMFVRGDIDTATKVLRWFGHHHLIELGVVSRERLHTYKTEDECRSLCRKYGIDQFVSGDLAALNTLVPTVSTGILLQSNWPQAYRGQDALLRHITPVQAWAQVPNILAAS